MGEMQTQGASAQKTMININSSELWKSSQRLSHQGRDAMSCESTHKRSHRCTGPNEHMRTRTYFAELRINTFLESPERIQDALSARGVGNIQIFEAITMK